MGGMSPMNAGNMMGGMPNMMGMGMMGQNMMGMNGMGNMSMGNMGGMGGMGGMGNMGGMDDMNGGQMQRTGMNALNITELHWVGNTWQPTNGKIARALKHMSSLPATKTFEGCAHPWESTLA